MICVTRIIKVIRVINTIQVFRVNRVSKVYYCFKVYLGCFSVVIFDKVVRIFSVIQVSGVVSGITVVKVTILLSN